MTDLRPVHVDIDTDPNNRGKIIAGAIVLLAVVAIGGFGYQAGWFHVTHEAVPDSRLPQASMPLNAPAKS
ncbi:MAG TPA: hypothetical protein VG501_05530 [Rhizomicrobium sp.]|nr:hypothetical protein [Rhizomicrobium sp.]